MARGSGSLGDIDLTVPVQQPEDLSHATMGLDIVQDAISYTQSRGIMAPALPAMYRGEMPGDLTSLDDNDLGDLLNRLGTYTGYLDSELAIAQSRMDSAKAQYEYLYARIRLSVKARVEGKLTDRDKTDLVITDPRVREAQAKMLYAEAVYRLTKNIRDQSQRNWETVSRRITQRGQEVERMKRESNVAGVQAQTPRRFQRPG